MDRFLEKDKNTILSHNGASSILYSKSIAPTGYHILFQNKQNTVCHKFFIKCRKKRVVRMSLVTLVLLCPVLDHGLVVFCSFRVTLLLVFRLLIIADLSPPSKKCRYPHSSDMPNISVFTEAKREGTR